MHNRMLDLHIRGYVDELAQRVGYTDANEAIADAPKAATLVAKRFRATRPAVSPKTRVFVSTDKVLKTLSRQSGA